VERALVAKTGVVVVDNTNTRRDDMQPYMDLARRHAYGVVIVELKCATAGDAIEFQRRSVHDLRFDTVMAMYHRYQDEDLVSIVINPYRKVVSSRNSIGSWLTKRGYVSPVAVEGVTHYIMATGVARLKFVCIPPSKDAWREFFAAYAADSGPKFLMDAVQHPRPFRFFMDLDDVVCDGHASSLATIEVTMREFAATISEHYECNVVVTWCTDAGKVGVHIHTDILVYGGIDAAVHYADAMYALTRLPFACDKEVYAHGMRMYASRKATHGVDCGREYVILCAAGPDVTLVSVDDILWWTSLSPLALYE
jgi:hypothetical protein